MPRPDRIMERNNNHTNHNGTGGNGFLLGVIVGVLLTLLFTTKRGRAILKEILEKGVEKFANLEEIMRMSEEEEIDEEFEDEDDYIPAEPVRIEQPAPEKKEVVKKVEEKPPAPQPEKIIKPEPEVTVEPEHTPQISEPTPKPEPESTEPKQEKLQVPVQEEEPVEKPVEKTKPAGKRWFRGLRKKS